MSNQAHTQQILKTAFHVAPVPPGWHMVWPLYNKLPYHNAAHAQAVFHLMRVLMKISSDKRYLPFVKAMELAVVYHDAGHTGNPDTVANAEGKFNIGIAAELLAAAILPKGYTEVDRTYAQLFLTMTQYPHVEFKDSATPGLEVAIGLIRDADMLHGMLPGMAYPTMLGYHLERYQADNSYTMPSIIEALTNQLAFIDDYQPFTSAGRQFKNFFHDDAFRAWAFCADRAVQANIKKSEAPVPSDD